MFATNFKEDFTFLSGWYTNCCSHESIIVYHMSQSIIGISLLGLLYWNFDETNMQIKLDHLVWKSLFIKT